MEAIKVTDKTNYAQSLMHMIKGNLGTGILAMPASFAHTGLVNAIIGLPILCIIATYCVHLLVSSSKHLEGKNKGLKLDYAHLAKHSFKYGPKWTRAYSKFMCFLVDGTLIVAQLGICCVYLVFVVDNLVKILASFNVVLNKTLVFFAILPVALFLSYIRTLRRLAIASACANALQAIGVIIILQYLVRDIDTIDLSERENFRPFNEVALGFGSAMFAFEGISVVLPIYTRMKNQDKMSGYLGVINVAYGFLLMLYFVMGLFGFLKFGHHAKDSITLNLPPEPLYDSVRALFTVSIFLTYPLQFYVPNEIIWNIIRKRLAITEPGLEISDVEIQSIKLPDKDQNGNQDLNEQRKQRNIENDHNKMIDRYEYICRTILVLMTFVLAVTVPKLNLLMDLLGSISGTALSLIIPALIHLSAYWDDTQGSQKVVMILADTFIIIIGLIASFSGSFFSLITIIRSFRHE